MTWRHSSLFANFNQPVHLFSLVFCVCGYLCVQKELCWRHHLTDPIVECFKKKKYNQVSFSILKIGTCNFSSFIESKLLHDPVFIIGGK